MGIWKCGEMQNIEMWKYGSMKYGHIGVWNYGTVEPWKYGNVNMEYGNLECMYFCCCNFPVKRQKEEEEEGEDMEQG